MPSIDFGNGPVEFRCTARTLVIYEQAFYNDKFDKVTGDMIADIFGKRTYTDDDLGLKFDDDGNLVALTVNMTMDNWNAEVRALWAMLRTQAEIDRKNGIEREQIPAFSIWLEENCDWEPDMREIASLVHDEMNRGLF